ncbi:endonuclease MutS2 [Lederbergia wuyishanensis]|uniref:Endonuclease MutS2 n=1 Tax=Lederbergia wuyishanensis TaxID=1347903 RepID=A0ABU0D5B1_9BACI|nr:endonuclease MutS2 [Lederbergia wuyishanensis]MCJ8009878.1 endonuclease MutS2 [Lederbergia wuyishanensis]MDQ0343585.1 DNA mismatch repair protein MutS2 [Lederbergia wuyishanensis]
MNIKILKTLEFNKILTQLEEFASSVLGVEKIKNLKPSTELSEVVEMQNETDEAAHVLRLKGHAPLSGIHNIKPHVKRAEIGGVLNAIELMQTASTIYAGRSIKRYIEGLLENEVEIPILEDKVNQIVILTDLEKQIKNAIDENGEVLDSASDTLRSIRQQARRSEGKIREKLEGLIRNRNAQKMLSDSIITIRNERYVIPVKQEYRAHYGGIVHDQSSSGQTLFIEPQAIVELNNALRELQLKEKQEIERILAELSAMVAESGEDLNHLVGILAELDFIFAKARFGKEMKATKPKINQDGIIRLFKARHPLLPIGEAIANDITLGDEYTSMVITGPNTGGKTITLKTVGLLTLMGQAGLQIPASEGSEVAVFKEVFADIGDEQSIEQSLSTFSSHMVNIVDILKKVDQESLVLFDELGAGTDPQEGAALAISILDEVYQRGAHVIATTHYPELKAYGYNRPGVINASVEFDVETLRPTYKLLIGIPGRSNAFEISKRLGLSDSVISYARTMIDTESNEVENMIASLEKSRKEAEYEYKEAHDYLKNAEKLFNDLQQQMIEFYDRKQKMYDDAEVKAAKVIEKAKNEAEQVMAELRQMRLEGGTQVKEHELIEARRKLDTALPKLDKMTDPTKDHKQKREFQPGDEVTVTTFGQKGHLIEKVGTDEWQVQIGIMKMKVLEKNLVFIKGEEKKETKPLATIKGRDFHVKLELDLRGERYEDALLKVEKYIDDALLANYPRVSIIHGKGTGALRTGVTDYLKHHRSVKRIRLGEAGEGGSGVTIVEFK